MLNFIKTHRYKICLIAILIIAVFFRFYNIAQMPPGLYPDEAMNGNNALEALSTGNFKIFYPENNGREGLFINIQALSVYIFGNEPWALRLVSAIFGVLTVWGVYLLAKELFRGKNYESRITNQEKETAMLLNSKFVIRNSSITALLSAFFLATSFWHTNFSRIGFRAIMLPFLTTFSFYFLFRGFRTKKILSFVWAGIFMGLGFHTYIAFRIVPFIVLAILILKLIEMIMANGKWQMANGGDDIKKDELKEFLLNIFIYTIFAFLAALPTFYYFYAHPEDFIGRAGQVSVFASENPLFELTKSAFLTFAQFNFIGDWNWRHNFAGSPLLFWPIGIFFLIGLWICVKNCLNYFSSLFPFLSFPWKRKSRPELNLDSRLRGNDNNNLVFPFLMLWFLAMLAPSILSTEGLPHALRTIGAIPPTFILAGLGTFAFANFAEKRLLLYANPHTYLKESLVINQMPNHENASPKNKGLKNTTDEIGVGVNKKLIALFYIIIISIIGVASYHKYFVAYANNPNIKSAFAETDVEIGRFLNNLPQDIKKYVIVEGENAVANQTTMFVSNSYRKADQLEKNIFYITWDEAEKINFYGEGKYVIIPLNKNERLFTKLHSSAPGELNKKKGFDYIIKLASSF